MLVTSFTTIAGIAALMGGRLLCQQTTLTQPIQMTSSQINTSSQLSTTVQFKIDNSNYTQLFDYNNDNYNNKADYPIYKSLNDSIGSIQFKFEQMENSQFYLNIKALNFEEYYNLYIGIEVYVTSDDSDNYSGTTYNQLDLSVSQYETWFFNTPSFNTNPNTFFNTDDGEVYITITLAPMDELSYYGTVDVETAYENGQEEGYQNGFADGIEYAQEQGTTAGIIFNGIVTVGLLPINFFLGILNFEVFGINIGGIVASLLTVAIVIIIVRIIFNGGNGGDNK